MSDRGKVPAEIPAESTVPRTTRICVVDQSATCTAGAVGKIKNVHFEKGPAPSEQNLNQSSTTTEPQTEPIGEEHREQEITRCRICQSSDKDQNGLGIEATGCNCRGSVSMCHRSCLLQWIDTRHCSSCELCGVRFQNVNGFRRLYGLFGVRRMLSQTTCAIVGLVLLVLAMLINFAFMVTGTFNAHNEVLATFGHVLKIAGIYCNKEMALFNKALLRYALKSAFLGFCLAIPFTTLVNSLFERFWLRGHRFFF